MFWPIYTTTWDEPFSEIRRLQREVNRIFGSGGAQTESFPAVNVWSNQDTVVVTAELPGMEVKDLDIQVNGDQLTVSGERKAGDPVEGVVCHRCERGVGKFARTLRLPFEVESGKVDAKYQQGVLTITLPRTESSKPRRIAVAAE